MQDETQKTTRTATHRPQSLFPCGKTTKPLSLTDHRLSFIVKFILIFFSAVMFRVNPFLMMCLTVPCSSFTLPANLRAVSPSCLYESSSNESSTQAVQID